MREVRQKLLLLATAYIILVYFLVLICLMIGLFLSFSPYTIYLFMVCAHINLLMYGVFFLILLFWEIGDFLFGKNE